MYESISIIEQCLEGLEKEKEGDITVKLKRYLKGSEMAVQKHPGVKYFILSFPMVLTHLQDIR